MKFDCGDDALTRRLRLTDWHRWFAWYPVRVGPRDCRWLEAVERRITYGRTLRGSWPVTEYRPAA
jgi:hypothetical protein